MPDIFDFWAECPSAARIHPQDQPVFDRPFVDKVGFNLDCLPACFAGKLLTAPVVLLYLSPGLAQSDIDEAGTVEAQARYADRRTGNRPLDGEADHLKHYQWWSSRTKVFGPPEIVRERVAILNRGAYHSKSFSGQLGLAALPSCRVSLDWAHTVLFPQAMDGERIVVCMRSAQSWGLDTGKTYGKGLFAPTTNRGGYMIHGDMREHVIGAVSRKLGTAAI